MYCVSQWTDCPWKKKIRTFHWVVYDKKGFPQTFSNMDCFSRVCQNPSFYKPIFIIYQNDWMKMFFVVLFFVHFIRDNWNRHFPPYEGEMFLSPISIRRVFLSGNKLSCYIPRMIQYWRTLNCDWSFAWCFWRILRPLSTFRSKAPYFFF